VDRARAHPLRAVHRPRAHRAAPLRASRGPSARQSLADPARSRDLNSVRLVAGPLTLASRPPSGQQRSGSLV